MCGRKRDPFAYLAADVWDEKAILDRASYLSSKALEVGGI
ncbi:hypothetical protein YDYSY3_47140 [Paenibacillus chitinolyticus]|nr:hypothetical protein YDYSY3_47140 [Paenibacillus chitinolyticus]